METAMSRIPTPATISDAPVASQPLLDAVKKQLGVVPNLFRLVSNSPAALEGYLNLSGALGKGALPAATRERIALAVAEINGCAYCLAATTSTRSPKPTSTFRTSPPERRPNRCTPTVVPGRSDGGD
jgi:alkylhydroperoxidase family enzyme